MLELNKIHHGDCIELMKQMPDNSVDLIVTDPPYGIDFQSAWRIESERFNKIQGDDIIDASFLKECYRILSDNSAIYVFTRWDVYPQWFSNVNDAGFKIKNAIIWDRGIHGLGDLKGSYAPRYDICIFAIKGIHKLNGKRPIDIIKVNRPNANKIVHPTQKPVRLIQHFIEKSSKYNDIVFDPFMGSGTTAIAAKQLNRRFIGCELSKEYVDIANERLKQGNLNDFFGSKQSEVNKEDEDGRRRNI